MVWECFCCALFGLEPFGRVASKQRHPLCELAAACMLHCSAGGLPLALPGFLSAHPGHAHHPAVPSQLVNVDLV